MKFREMARIRRLQAQRKYQAISEPAPLFDYKAIHAEALTLRALLPLGLCPRPPHSEVVRSLTKTLEGASTPTPAWTLT